MNRNHRMAWTVGVLLATSVVLVLARLHALALPLETDEANYAYIAGRLLAGDQLYVDVWDHQPPGVFILFAATIALFGDAPETFRWVATGFSLASLITIFLLIRHAVADRWAAFAALIFALVSSDPGTAGEGCNREIYMNTFILIGWYAALRAGDRNRSMSTPWWLLASGTAFAAASLLKTIVAIHWLAAAGWLGWCSREESQPVPRRFARGMFTLLMFSIPPAVIWLGTFGYFAAADRLADVSDAIFGFNLSYSKVGDGFWSRFLVFFTPGAKPYLQPFIFDSAAPLWIAALTAIPALGFSLFKERDNHAAPARRASAILALFMLLAAYLATCLPAQFWPHYYYLMLPPAIVVTVLALERVCTAVRSPGWRSGVAATAVTAMFVAILHAEYRHYYSQPLFGITVGRYNGRDFWGRAHGENVRRVTQPDDEIFVYGADAAIYYYAQRKCASRFTMLTGLRSGYTGHEQRRPTMLREIAEHRPRLILVVLGEESFPAWKDFLPTRYDAVGWDFRDRAPHDPILMILCDRERPIEAIDWNWDRAAIGGWNLGDAR